MSAKKTWVFLAMICAAASVLASTTRSCEYVLFGFNEYEVLKNKAIESRFSVFSLIDYSQHSAYRGLLVTEPDLSIKLEVDFKNKKKPRQTHQFGVERWGKDDRYFVAVGFSQHQHLSLESGMSGITYTVLRSGVEVCKQSFKVSAY